MDTTERVEQMSTYQPLADFQTKGHTEQQPTVIEDQWHDTEPFQAQQEHDHDWAYEIDSAIDSAESIACVTTLPFSTQPLTA